MVSSSRMAQNERQLRAASSLLDFEAADYFKLDPTELRLFGNTSLKCACKGVRGLDECANYRLGHAKQVRTRMGPNDDKRRAAKRQSATSMRYAKRGVLGAVESSLSPVKGTSATNSLSACKQQHQNNPKLHRSKAQVVGQSDGRPKSHKQVERKYNGSVKSEVKYDPKQRLQHDHTQQHFVGSSTTSTSSLPSISSSPSVSPSLVCPHVSLDDLLRLRNEPKSGARSSSGGGGGGGGQRSPHTIGLCARCQTNAPPNVHSPLSPMYRSSRQSFASATRPNETGGGRERSRSRSSSTQATESASKGCSLSLSAASLPGALVDELPVLRSAIRRGHSDGTRIGAYVRSRTSRETRRTNREHSIDHCLESHELRRMQMSPTLRHSVEFIRSHSIESARVVRVFKNGEPFDKPLRICITRGEFSTLEHLLNHINGRQLIACGARYLFHLDGQVVYSVHELKHKSAYVVSGVRQFHYKAAAVLKERLRREAEAEANLQRRKQFVALKSSVEPNELQRVVSRDNGEQLAKFSASAAAATTTSGSEAKQSAGGAAKGQPVRSKVGQRSLGKVQASDGDEKLLANEALVERRNHKRVSSGSSMAQVDALNERIHLCESDGHNFDSMEVFVDESERFGDERVREQNVSGQAKRKPMTRAKSELSALQPKRKKNVTFIDTGRGSSPTIYTTNESSSDLNRTQPKNTEEDNFVASESTSLSKRKPSLKALSTSEIGIQVSDSLDGHLIDLPIPLPEKDTSESGKDSTGRGPTRDGQARASGRGPAGRSAGGGSRAQRGAGARGKGKIMAFSERQLSVDEMSQLADMDRGDHHNGGQNVAERSPPEVRIHLEPHSATDSDDDRLVEETARTEPAETDRVERGLPTEEVEQAEPSSVVGAAHLSDGRDAAEEEWQYPGGRESSATPVERPVSQNDAHESVRARVTTPTPSLSTGGDNNSLTMSYESPNQLSGGAGGYYEDGESTGASPSPSQVTSQVHSKGSGLPAKQVIEVRGTLCDGLDPPARNFKLEWVGGFTINDQYPDNSTTIARAPTLTATGSPTAPNEQSGSPAPQTESQLLSPNNAQTKSLPIDFKPSERFNNWICHSRLHDELIYPAGALIVLWSRWTNSQRYYSKHTANVSCLTLASLDLDLAASAQVADLPERMQPMIHLWSLTNLTTLLVVGEDQFRGRRIISLRVRHSTSLGCELSVAARDEKYLWLYAIQLDSSQVRSTGAQPADERRTKSTVSVSKVNKLLQGTQLPLLLTNLAEDSSQAEPRVAPEAAEGKSAAAAAAANQKSAKRPKLKQAAPDESAPPRKSNNSELLVSFGRKHFQIWSVEKRQNTLRPLQADKKESKFVEMISKANCLARLSPAEFLLGDSSGNIALITMQLNATSGRVVSGIVKSIGSKTQRYSIETVPLVGPSSEPSRESQLGRGQPSNAFAAVTCVARISGNLFASGDSNCNVKFWRLQRTKSAATNQFKTVTCQQVSCISLPSDLGFICTILAAKYDRKRAIVEFYVVSTSNAILFGQVKLAAMLQAADDCDVLANSSLSVVYEGHETCVSGLVADIPSGAPLQRSSSSISPSSPAFASDLKSDASTYFTCSLDCKVCKWNKHKLVWKSMLPSACFSIAAHPSGSVLAVGSIDGTVYILDKLSGLLISYFPLTPVRINCLGYARDGSLLAAGCLNGSIFMLPVQEKGLKYRKVSIFQSPHPVVSLQFSIDNRYILTSVTHGSYQELILWDLPNFRYMRDNVKLAADKLEWFDPICSGSEDVRATWENANIDASGQATGATSEESGSQSTRRQLGLSARSSANKPSEPSFRTPATVINLSCHRLIHDRNGNRLSGSIARNPTKETPDQSSDENFAIASDTRGYLRLFRYPCNNIDQGFYAIRTTSDPMNCCRFLVRPVADRKTPVDSARTYFVTSSLDGNICIWSLE